jgi:CheY-like chemotaxis protein
LSTKRNPITILMTGDYPDDRLLTEEALAENRLANNLHVAENGEDLLDYLHHREQNSEMNRFARPGLILLDLYMSNKDGREALEEIKTDPNLRQIPVLVLTTSKAEEVVIPHIGGQVLVHRLSPLYSRLKILFIASYSDNAVVNRDILKSGNGFLQRPFSSEQLACKVQEMRNQKG